MHETQKRTGRMLNACFIISIAGILLLLFLSDIIQPPLIEISSISKDMIDKSISVRGMVESEKNLKGLHVLELCSNNVCIPVTLSMSKTKENATISFVSFIGKDVIATGRVAEYKSELQINADRIMKAN